MPLDELLETIATLRERIEDHGSLLSQNETRTRYALIDPLLGALGWDVGNPAEVVPEQDASGGRADYGLLDENGKPAVVVEAKRLDRPLKDGLNQSIAYRVGQGTPYFAVTDGRRWAIYETFRQVAVNEKMITEFDVLADSPAKASLQALALWRPSVQERQVVVAKKPIVGTGPSASPTSTTPVPNLPNSTGQSVPATGEGWLTLAGQRPEQGAKKPIGVLCPSGEQIEMQNWHGLRRQIVKWLVERGHLGATEARNPDYHRNSANEVRLAEANIKKAGLNPADFKVRLAD